MSSSKSSLSIVMSLAVAIGFSLPGMTLEQGAKGLFRDQMEQPDKNLNTGLQYWIELHRSGKMSKVSNKYKFQNGDKIKFHVKSNINGYAYILLKSGSRGEQSVLFPDDSAGDENKVERGKDYILPEVGFLAFDENPGNEKVTLLLSRTPINAQAYLDQPSEAPTLIASAMTGSKDLIPQKVLVAYGNPNRTFPSSSLKVKSSEQEDEKPVVAKKPPVRKPVKETKPPVKVAKTPETNKISKKPHSRAASNSSRDSKSDDDETGVVTVVSELPGNMLHIDVDLHHI